MRLKVREASFLRPDKSKLIRNCCSRSFAMRDWVHGKHVILRALILGAMK